MTKPAALPTPAFDAYIARIGAEQLNFRKYIVREWKEHYYKEIVTIRINDDGAISCRADYGPTDDEAKEIKVELPPVIATWPRSMNTQTAEDLRRKLRKMGSGNPVLFEFYDRRPNENGHIIMLQQRIEKPDGKEYRPWTFWSDGEWRPMEPTHRKLPLWKPKDKRGPSRIMVHEGPKVASFIDDLLYNPKRRDERAKHPWIKDLEQYEHWGAIGGALAPQRTDYEELRRERSKAVVYVCDNDDPGRSVLQQFSKYYYKTMKGIQFEHNWPPSWDMAEPIPANQFDKEGRYIGRSLQDLMIAATYATQTVPPSSKGGRPTHALRPDFVEEWMHTVKPDVYIHRDFPDRIWSAKEFDDQVSPFSQVPDTSRLVRATQRCKAEGLRYDPSSEPGVYVAPGGGRFVNVHVPSAIVAEKGEVKPFREFMEHLIPDKDDRFKTDRWVATLIARPEIRMRYGLLLISKQGVGKGTLGANILKPLVGELNTSVPSETEVIDSNYNYWLAHKRLAIVHEIYAGHSSKAYNTLKTVITDDDVTVRQKYLASYTIENWIHIFACSNSPRALLLAADDRRWLVPKVNEEAKPREYWDQINDWLVNEGGLRKIRWWAENFVAEHGPVLTGENAPSTAKKKEVIKEGYSPGMQLADDILRAIKQDMDDGTIKGPVLIADTAIVAAIKDTQHEGRVSDKLEKPSTIRKVAEAGGWYISDARAFVKEWGTRLIGPRLICSDPADAKTSPGTLAKDGRKLLNISEFVRRNMGI